MDIFIMMAIVGVICIVIGIMNMRGNISTLHSYHTHRVSEKDRGPFGRMVGVGMITIGSNITAAGAFLSAYVTTLDGRFSTIGYIVMVAGMVVGFGFILYALIKYNKGIF